MRLHSIRILRLAQVENRFRARRWLGHGAAEPEPVLNLRIVRWLSGQPLHYHLESDHGEDDDGEEFA